jgi:hypothetical protein
VVVGQLENRWAADSITLLEERTQDAIAEHPFFCRFAAVLSLSCRSSHRKKCTLGGSCVRHT